MNTDKNPSRRSDWLYNLIWLPKKYPDIFLSAIIAGSLFAIGIQEDKQIKEKNKLKQQMYQIANEDTNSVEGLYRIAKDLGVVNEWDMKYPLLNKIENASIEKYKIYIHSKELSNCIESGLCSKTN